MQVITETSPYKKRKRQRRKLNKKLKRAQSMRVVYGYMHSDGTNYYYTVGEREHEVTLAPDGTIKCDCNNHPHCSHVIAVRMFRGERY